MIGDYLSNFSRLIISFGHLKDERKSLLSLPVHQAAAISISRYFFHHFLLNVFFIYDITFLLRPNVNDNFHILCAHALLMFRTAEAAFLYCLHPCSQFVLNFGQYYASIMQ